jgi:hypothetical protein
MKLLMDVIFRVRHIYPGDKCVGFERVEKIMRSCGIFANVLILFYLSICLTIIVYTILTAVDSFSVIYYAFGMALGAFITIILYTAAGQKEESFCNKRERC